LAKIEVIFKDKTMIKPMRIDAGKLDLVMRDEDFVIYYDGSPFLTKGGVEFAHKNARVLKHILLKLTLNPELSLTGLNSAALFSFLKDWIEKKRDLIDENYEFLFEHDFVIRARFEKRSEKTLQIDEALEFLDKNQDVMNLIFWSNSLVMEGFRSLLSQLSEDKKENQPSADSEKESCRNYIREKYLELTQVQKAGINLLSLRHKNGIILPLMLVLNIISPSEYSNSMLAVHSKSTLNDFDEVIKSLVSEFGIQPLVLDQNPPLQFVAEIHSEALKTLEFLRFFGAEHRKISVVTELISRGESDNLEFKSTFRWDIRQNKKNPAIEHASLKTMAAFMNSDGGDLLIGVEDDGNILGVEMDGFPNDDKFLLHLWSLIKSSMGQDISPYLKTTLEKFDGKSVCRVQCLPSPKPIFLRQKGFDESFYIRIGPSTGSLEISEALKYIADHFKV